MRVLLLEDDALLAGAVRRALGRHGIAVVVKDTVAEAIAAVDNDSFDAVLSDVHLGPVSAERAGLDLVRHVKRTGGPPVIVYTGTMEHGVVRDALLAGAADCLFKDRLDPMRLAAALRALRP